MMKDGYSWRKLRNGQIALDREEDLTHLEELDRKRWAVISIPVEGIRFDRRTLELMDTDRDGRIRMDEVLSALRFLRDRGVPFSEVLNPPETLVAQLADVTERLADLTKTEPSETEKAALADWETRGASSEVAVLGSATAAAADSLAAVEPLVDAYFTPADDMPLVTDEPDRTLPLRERLNPRHREAIARFAEACVKPILGDVAVLSRADWESVKARFVPFRAWRDAKPVFCADARARLEDEERTIRYRLHLRELLENYVNMRRLYDPAERAIFQTGTLRIDARELTLCCHVADEAAHAELAAKSSCCLLYVKLTRPAEKATREICAVVTAGTVGGLYVGRNGVFTDRDGQYWEATVVKVVESQISLAEAFWSPWRKIGACVSAAVKKALGARQSAAVQAATAAVAKPTESGNGAALASSVAAVGIGLGMVTAAAATLMAAIAKMSPLQLATGAIAFVAIVSLPSVILTWFKLRRRDLGAVLNASGWAVNRPLRFSCSLAKTFTSRA